MTLTLAPACQSLSPALQPSNRLRVRRHMKLCRFNVPGADAHEDRDAH